MYADANNFLGKSEKKSYSREALPLVGGERAWWGVVRRPRLTREYCGEQLDLLMLARHRRIGRSGSGGYGDEKA
jgi:hypothetical protein